MSSTCDAEVVALPPELMEELNGSGEFYNIGPYPIAVLQHGIKLLKTFRDLAALNTDIHAVEKSGASTPINIYGSPPTATP